MESAEYAWNCDGNEEYQHRAVVEPVPDEDSTGAPLWVLIRSDWISCHLYDEVSLVPGLPLRPLIIGSFANTVALAVVVYIGLRLIRRARQG